MVWLHTTTGQASQPLRHALVHHHDPRSTFFFDFPLGIPRQHSPSTIFDNPTWHRSSRQIDLSSTSNSITPLSSRLKRKHPFAALSFSSIPGGLPHYGHVLLQHNGTFNRVFPSGSGFSMAGWKERHTHAHTRSAHIHLGITKHLRAIWLGQELTLGWRGTCTEYNTTRSIGLGRTGSHKGVVIRQDAQDARERIRR